MLQLDKMDASARQKAEMAQKIAQELLKASNHRTGAPPYSMPALNSEQSNLVRAAQQKAAEIAVQVPSCPCMLPSIVRTGGVCTWGDQELAPLQIDEHHTYSLRWYFTTDGEHFDRLHDLRFLGCFVVWLVRHGL